MNEQISENRVAQPPSAVAAAKSAKASYKRNLPHIQAEDKTFFITFTTWKRWQLPAIARDLVLKHCLHDHALKLHLHGVVVMPDHVHMVFTPLKDQDGKVFGLAEILNGIKGSSAHSVNKLLQRKGHVWQDESFDHILRSDESVSAKVDYICQNPIRAKLVHSESEYPWLWREWIEGVAQPSPAVIPVSNTAGAGCATSEEEA